MIGMKKILTLLCALAALAACQDDFVPDTGTGTTAEGLTDIYLAQTGMPVIVTRADDAATQDDNRVESVILFVFSEQGELLNTPVQQSVTQVAAPDDVAEENKSHTFYRFRAYLPENKYSLYAVCNYEADEVEALINSVSGNHTSGSDLDALKAFTYSISSVDEAYKGVFVMSGSTTNVSDTPLTIPVTRVVSRHTFHITFNPEKAGDLFKLSSVSIFNVPKKSYLIGRADDAENKDAATTNDDYLGGDPAPLDGSTPGTPVELDVQSDVADSYTATTHLFENRRGAVSQDDVDIALDITSYPDEEKQRIRQLFKRDLAYGTNAYSGKNAGPFPLATCLLIQGLYEDNNDPTFTDGKAYEVSYYVYLGHDNFGDFNVKRNTDYQYEITIRACDEIDTRVNAVAVGQIKFDVSKQSQPFDAHYNVREALLYSTTDWEVYVENPDETPWLEISTSPVYKKRELGASAADNEYAQFRLTGSESLRYIYIHTDEYVPHITDVNKNSTLPPRTGYICFKYKGQNEDEVQTNKFKVVQYPAQLVMVQENNIAGIGTGQDRYFFVERITEEKYKDWGFRGFWNLTLDNLISTGYYDGLSNTRKEYVSAIWGDKNSDSFKARTETINDPAPLELDGAQDAAYWQAYNEDGDFIQPEGNAIFNLSTSFALGYALAKNRDRNGNGRIDYNEILWYLPARKQLKAIAEAIDNNQLYGTDYDEESDSYPTGSYLTLDGNYWSSTPSVSDKYGITPGRAYYVKMGDASEAIGLRDQSFNVIVCRDANGWPGPDSGHGQGGVDLDPDWGDEEENMPGQKTKNK